MTSKRPVATLRFATLPDYTTNLDTLVTALESLPSNAVVVAPEVCLTGFDYEHFDAAAAFAQKALERLLALPGEQILVLTMIERREDGIYNVAKVLHRGRVVHEQAKVKLFKLGDEHSHFSPGSEEEIVPFEIEGIRLGILICFELRFKSLWQQLEGCDIIAVPAQWGRLRSEHFVTLSEALAVMNQCYVLASDAANEETSGQSGIISPFGAVQRNGNVLCLEGEYSQKEVQRMRRYLDVGING